MVREIRQLRAKGISQKKVAAIVGVHQRTVEKYETEESEAHEKFRELAKYERDKQQPDKIAKRRVRALEWYHVSKGKTMDRNKLATAVNEARRFIERAEALPEPETYEASGRTFTHDNFPREQGAIRRASMDLTRALSDLRK